MTITADFSGGEKTATTEPLYQWDTGQKLALSGLPATSTDIQVHFANAAMAQAIVKATATENSLPTCDIPNEFLQYGSAAKARAWVFYKASSTEGYTVRTVLIPVTPRKRPNDYVSPEDPDSQGIVDRAIELLEGYEDDLASKLSAAPGAVDTENLADKSITVEKVADDLAAVINAKAPASTAYTFDTTTTNVVYSADNPKTIYLNATVNGEHGIVVTAKDNNFQYFLGRSGTLKIRFFSGGTSYSNWAQVTEHVDNKKNSITSSNKTSTDFYPSIKAVVDYLVANYENLSNKLTSADGIDEDSTDNEYPTAKAVYNFVEIVTDDIYTDLETQENLSNKKTTITGYETSNQFYPTIKALVDYVAANYENLSNKLSSEEGIDSSSTDTKYPSAKAVYDLGVEILALVNDDISNVESRLVLKESASNKQSSITTVNKESTTLYPSIKAVYDYGSQISSAVEDVKAYIGYTDGDILGLHADFENKVFTRLGAAVGLNAGSDFNAFPMYGQRRRVVVDSDGAIIDSYSPEDVGESDTDVDVMVYQPKFYYKVVPIKLEKQSSGLGYHIRKANYYISSTPHAGFKPHPLFFDKNGNEIDYVLFSAYEASYMWRRQVSTNGTDSRYVDSIFHDGVNTDTTIETSAVLKSLPGVKPISGKYKAMNKVNMENCALRKSPNWHLDTIQSISANQLLMTIEYASFNTQSAIGLGIVNNPDSDTINCSSLTGSTSAETFNTASGMASETIYDIEGTETPFNTNGNVAVSYRGMENPWGNIWKQVNGINIWGDGTMNGGQAYICSDFSFDESKRSGNYKSTGFSIANANNYISALGYGSEKYDWLFLPSETLGNNALPVGDKCYVTANLNGNKIALHGGAWYSGDSSGDYDYSCANNVELVSNAVGGRLLYVPTATV